MSITTFIGLSAFVTAVYGTIHVCTQVPPHSIKEEFRDMPSDFGPDIAADGMRGFLVVGMPVDGCSNMTKPPVIDNFTGNWFVLIAKHTSECTYETQVRNAQAAGFQLAIVHNVNSSYLDVMTADNPDGIDIPSVFVSDVAGLALSEDYLYDKGFYIMVDSELPFNINTHLLLPFAIVVVLCLLVILIFMIVKCIKDRRRARRHRLPHRALSKIPTCKFCKGYPYDTCAICLDDYQEGDKLRVLPCAHAYHTACIDPWLTQNKRVCPVCKRRVFAAGERRRLHSDSGSDSDSDTAPLLPARHHATGGGTFDQQQENPFARATRFMARLRARAGRGDPPPDVSDADSIVSSAPSENNDHVNTNNDENGNAEESRASVRAERERPPRRAERARPSRRAARRHNLAINSARGEIGVAAIPARAASTPRHINL